MTALIERHRHDRVAGLDGGEINRHVRRAAAVRLDVGVLGAEKFARAPAGEFLRRVDGKAARIPALARIPFRILVHQHAAGGFAAGARGGVLGGDEIDFGILLNGLRVNRRVNFRIVLHQARGVAQTPGALEFPTAARVTLVLVDRSGDECLGDLRRIFGRDDVGAETENVGAVVLTGKRGRIGGVADRRAHVLEAIGAHRHSDAAAADQNTEIGFARGDVLGHGDGIIGIVAGALAGGAFIDNLRNGRKLVGQQGLKFDSSVIGSDGNFHDYLLIVRKFSLYYTKIGSSCIRGTSAQKLQIAPLADRLPRKARYSARLNNSTRPGRADRICGVFHRP